jgi:hypothetical protein
MFIGGKKHYYQRCIELCLHYGRSISASGGSRIWMDGLETRQLKALLWNGSVRLLLGLCTLRGIEYDAFIRGSGSIGVCCHCIKSSNHKLLQIRSLTVATPSLPKYLEARGSGHDDWAHLCLRSTASTLKHLLILQVISSTSSSPSSRQDLCAIALGSDAIPRLCTIPYRFISD